MTKILKLDKHNEQKEIEFEINYTLSLPLYKRFELMFNKTKELLKLQKKHGNRKTTKIIKRK